MIFVGFSAHYVHHLSNDFMRNVSAELFLMTPFGTRFVEQRGADSLSVSLAFAALDSLCSFCLSPFEVVRLHLVSQSFLYGEKRLNGILDTLKTTHAAFGVKGLYPTPALTAISKLVTEVTKTLPAFFLEWLVTRFSLDTDSALVQALLVASDMLLVNASLLLTLPLETVRNRMIATQLPLISNARIPIRKEYKNSWHCASEMVREEGIAALYQGLGFRMLQNTLGLLSAWMLHLNGVALAEEEEEEDF